jgi:hypothetical protein
VTGNGRPIGLLRLQIVTLLKRLDIADFAEAACGVTL